MEWQLFESYQPFNLLKMLIQLKKKHIAFCVSQILLQDPVSNLSILLHLSEKIKAGVYGNEDLIQFEISKTVLIEVFNQLGGLNERFAAAFNEEMKALLLPQFIELSQNQDPLISVDAIDVLQTMQAIDVQRDLFINDAVKQGIDWLIR